MICNRYLPQLVPYSSCVVTRAYGITDDSTCKIERCNEGAGRQFAATSVSSSSIGSSDRLPSHCSFGKNLRIGCISILGQISSGKKTTPYLVRPYCRKHRVFVQNPLAEGNPQAPNAAGGRKKLRGAECSAWMKKACDNEARSGFDLSLGRTALTVL